MVPGYTELTYRAIANLPGVYGVSPTEAYQRLAPDVMGMTGASINSFVIKEGIASLEDGLTAFGISEVRSRSFMMLW